MDSLLSAKSLLRSFRGRVVFTIFVSLISLVLFDSSAAFAGVISTRKVDYMTMEGIDDQSFLGLEMLDGLRASDPPEELVAAIDLYFLNLQNSDSQPTDPWHGVVMPLGALWGEQICLKYGWTWENVWLDEHQGDSVYAIVSPDNSMLIYPFKHLFQCLGSGKTVAVSQVYQAIGKNKKLLELPAGSYNDILSNLALLVF